MPNPDSRVTIRKIHLNRIEKIDDNRVIYRGMSEGDQVAIEGILKGCRNIHSKSIKKQKMFDSDVFQTWYESNNGIIEPREGFDLYLLIEVDTGIAYSHTLTKIVKLDEPTFLRFLNGSDPIEPEEVTYNMGEFSITVKGKNFLINLGSLNGNSPIIVSDENGSEIFHGRHKKGDIKNLCKKINDL